MKGIVITYNPSTRTGFVRPAGDNGRPISGVPAVFHADKLALARDPYPGQQVTYEVNGTEAVQRAAMGSKPAPRITKEKAMAAISPITTEHPLVTSLTFS